VPQPLALISLPGKETALNAHCASELISTLSCAQRFLRAKNNIQGAQDQGVYFFSREMITRLAKLIAVSLAVAVLLIPVFLLSVTQMTRTMTSTVVLIFVLVFAILISILSGAGTESVFIGTCA
jgi:VIT1/CCC1 family predicted Fe2+/Mn2+ transporter